MVKKSISITPTDTADYRETAANIVGQIDSSISSDTLSTIVNSVNSLSLENNNLLFSNRETNISPKSTIDSNNEASFYSVEDQQRDITETVLNFVPLDNELNNYHNYTYNFKFFMLSDAPLNTTQSLEELYNQIDNRKKIILAESGVTTGFNIESIEIDSAVAPNFKTRNTNRTTFSIKINEFYGTSFLDTIRKAAKVLGVKNWNSIWYFLELTFVGYNEITGEPLRNIAGGSEHKRWIWSMQISDINTKVTSSGSTYDISAISYNDSAFNSEYNRLPEHVHVLDARTIGEMFDEAKKAMNDAWLENYGQIEATNKTGIVEFDFKFHGLNIQEKGINYTGDQIRNWKLTPKEQKYNDFSVKPIQIDNNNGISVEIPRGANITDIVEFAFLSSETAQGIGIGRTDKGATSSIETDDYRISTVFRVHADVNINGWDYITKQYAKKITFHIVPYVTLIPILDESDLRNATSEETQRKATSFLIERNLLQKRYDYIFTGLNTEVFDFDINYNLAWTAVLPRFQGHKYTHQAVTDHALFNEAKENIEKIKLLKSEIQTIENDIVNIRNSAGTFGDSETDIENIRAIALLKKQQQEMERDVNNLLDFNRSAYERSIEKNMESSNLVEQYFNVNTELYAEDLVLEELDSGLENEITISQKPENARQTEGIGLNNQWHRDKSIFATALDQLYTPITKNFVNILLDIKGDPYWLGSTNIDSYAFLNSNERISNLSSNFLGGDNTFIFSFNAPKTLNEKTFKPEFESKDNVFNGIYNVYNVLSVFRNGKFTQQLSGQRLPLISLYKVLGATPHREQFDPGVMGTSGGILGRNASGSDQ